MNAKLSLDGLAVFRAVAEAGGFSSAAKKLGMTTSTVSRTVGALEEQVGAQLLHRTTRKVALSTAGEALLRRVAAHLAALDDTLAQLAERDEEPSGTLRVTAPVDLGIALLAELAARFTARHPGVTLDVHLSNRRVDLVAEGFDVALRAGARLDDSSLVARKASPVTGGLFASPAYLARRGTPRSPAYLASHDWVVFRAFKTLKLEGGVAEPRGRVICDDMLYAREAARAGIGIAYLPLFLAAADVAAGQLVRILPRQDVHIGWLWIVHPAMKHVPRKIVVFRELLLESLRVRAIV